MSDFNEHNYLCHYGIKGMKWGIRRYQNPDGSLTSAGKARYGGEKAEKYRAKLLKKANKMNKYGEYGRAITNIKAMSNDELAKELIERDSKAKKAGAYAAGFSTGVSVLAKHFGILEADKEMAEIVSDTTGLSPELSYVLAQVSGFTTEAIGGYFTGKNAYKRQYAVDLIKDYNKKPISKTKVKHRGQSYAAEKEKHNVFYSKTEQKQIKKEHKENVHIEEKRLSAKYEAREKEIREEIDRLAKKYDFDLDDGGGGKTKEDEKAGARYMLLWEEIDDLDRQRRNEAIDISLKKIEDKYGKSGTVYAKKAWV